MSAGWVSNDRFEADSMTDLVEFAANAPSPLELSRQSSRTEEGYGGWYGTPNFEAATKTALTGWAEGLSKLEKFRLPLIDKLMPVILQPEITYQVVGNGGLDMGRVMSGMPDPFMEWEDSSMPVFGSGRQLVRIVMNVAASCSVSGDVITARGATIAALADILEAAGRRVSIVIACGVQHHGRRVNIVTLAKEPAAPLSLDTATFALAHPSMFRRLYFSVMERHPDQAWALALPRGYYGHPTAIPGNEQGDIYVPEAHGSWTDSAYATQWVKEVLKAQGVEFDSERA